MATRTRSKSKSKARSQSSTNGETSGGVRAGKGVRVKSDLSNPHVARITIEIDWDELISRVVAKMGKTIMNRRARGARRAQRASASTR